jgi:hypothetical protein
MVLRKALTSRWLLKWVTSSSDRPNIYTNPCVNGLLSLVQHRSWLSGSGQMLSNENEAILNGIIRLAEYLYHVELPSSAARGAAVMPSSTNLHTNMLSVSIGAHKYAACFYWHPPSSYLCEPAVHISMKHGTSFYCRHCWNVFLALQHKFRQKYGEAFYWVEQQHGFAWKF